MNRSSISRVGRIILIGVVYAAVGIAFPNPSSADQSQLWWRLGAWLVCAIVFGIHILYENIRIRNTPFHTALHASMSVALGAFALAVSANIHAMQIQTGNQGRLLLALVVWPFMTAVPSFLVALTSAFILNRLKSYIKQSR